MDAMGVNLSTGPDWQCEKCTLINPGRINICQACGRRKQRAESWICNACASENTQSLVLCNNCGSERFTASSVIPDASTADGKQWTCSRCTLTNALRNNTCSACGHDPGLVVADPAKETTSTEPSSNRKLYPDLTLELYSEIAQQSSEVLKCHKCQSLLYDNAGLHCTVCHSPCPEEGFKPRPFPESSKPRASKDLDNQKWSCSGCTFENKASNSICELCGSGREVEPKPSNSGETTDSSGPSAVDTGWPCPTCTLVNSPATMVCSACETKKNDISDKQNSPTSPEPTASPGRTMQRQKSIPVESRRKRDEKQAKEQWINIVKYCKNNSIQFVDDSFPPTEKSLYLQPRFSEHPRVANWLRPQQIQSFRSGGHGTSTIPLAVFRNPRPDDIMQGVLGDCWFLSAMAVLGERPELLEKIVITREVPNYLPSISAAIGDHMPEKFIWCIGIALHCLPRILLFPAALHKHYRKSLSGQKYNLSTWWFWLLNLLANISQVVENGALLTLTYISSTDNFAVHEASFIVFMVCAMLHMFLSCILFKLTSEQPLTIEGYSYLKNKVCIMFFNYCSFGLAVYFFFRHNWYCEPGMYTLFALCEYCTIVSNIAFHWYSLTRHFKGAVVSLAYSENNMSKMY